jgi:hypothetical protein
LALIVGDVWGEITAYPTPPQAVEAPLLPIKTRVTLINSITCIAFLLTDQLQKAALFARFFVKNTSFLPKHGHFLPISHTAYSDLEFRPRSRLRNISDEINSGRPKLHLRPFFALRV